VVLLPAACWMDVFGSFAAAELARDEVALARRAADARRVVLISVDGLAPRVLARTPTPTLDRLAAEGRVARRAETVVPSSTLPSHTSMLSGLAPEDHGVTWNRYAPWRDFRVRTVFSLCREHALRCGLFAGKRKFAHLAENEPGAERWLHGQSAEEVFAAAARYVAARDPDFTMVHVAEVDRAGHADGWGSPAQREALERIDAALGAFLEEVRAAGSGRLAVLVTADHGGHGTRHGSALADDVEIPWLLWGDGIPSGRIAGSVSTLDTGPTVLRLLGVPSPGGWSGQARWPASAASSVR
jgi:predicted AlkP superfamily pyrophosphatase or phosphodiesterase